MQTACACIYMMDRAQSMAESRGRTLILPRRTSAKSVFPGTGLPRRRASGLCRCGALRVALAVVANLHSSMLRIDIARLANAHNAFWRRDLVCFAILRMGVIPLCECGGSCECRSARLANVHDERPKRSLTLSIAPLSVRRDTDAAISHAASGRRGHLHRKRTARLRPRSRRRLVRIRIRNRC